MLGFLGGVWLILAPSALGYQTTGAGWINATRNDHWLGIGLAIISVAGLVLYTLSLLREIREGDVILDGEAVHEQHPERHVSPRPSPDALQKNNGPGPLVEPSPSKTMEDTRRRQRLVQPEEIASKHPLPKQDRSREQRGGKRFRFPAFLPGAALALVAVVLFIYARRVAKKS